MQESKIINDFIELVSLPVEPRNERAIADAVKGKLAGLGFTVTEDDAAAKVGGNTGNIIARLKGEDGIPPVLFSSHLDRVANHGAIKPILRAEDDLITSDGTSILAADDVAGICVILDAIRQIQAEGRPHGDIEIVFTVCEELGLLGASHLDYTQLASKQAYILDNYGRLGKIVNSSPTRYILEAKIHGKSAHAGGMPEQGINAVKVGAVALSRLPEGRLSKSMTSVFASFNGGGPLNIVPDYAEVKGEVRGTDDAEIQKQIALIQETFAQAAAEYGATVELSCTLMYRFFRVEESEPVTQIALRALKKHGIEGWCEFGGGGFDGNHFVHNGIRTISLGMGYAKNHTPNEELIISDFLKTAEVVRDIITEIYNSGKA